MRLKSEEFVKGQYYHIYNHAVSNNLLFYDEEDYQMCLLRLSRYYDNEDYSILAYCLMPNHYHFLLYQKTDNSFSSSISRLWYSFSCYYNKKYSRRGTIFAGKQQHIGIRNEDYLKYLCVYIHLNPVKAKLVDSPEAWEWSDYRDWLGVRDGMFIDRELISHFFQTPADYQECINSLIDIPDKRLLIDA